MATPAQRQGLANVKKLVESVIGQRVIFDHIIEAMQVDIVYEALAEQTKQIMESKGALKEVKAPEPAPKAQEPEATATTKEEKKETGKAPKKESVHFVDGKVIPKTGTKSTTKSPAKKVPAKKAAKKGGRK